MAKFSDRYGYTSAEKAFQREALSNEIRVALWNALKIFLWDKWSYHEHESVGNTARVNVLVKRIWVNHLNRDLDSLPVFQTDYGNSGAYDQLKLLFFRGSWFEVFNFLEYLAQNGGELVTAACLDQLNKALEKENSAYRFIGKEIVEITDEGQIEAINRALAVPLPPVKAHLSAALAMLSDKVSPDYRNSIKESISAVEAACREVAGRPAATLSDALKGIAGLHPALQKAFLSLYGYTSDANGIRHALLDEPTLTKQDAVFMLVACSAFIGYLSEYRKA